MSELSYASQEHAIDFIMHADPTGHEFTVYRWIAHELSLSTSTMMFE